jgi:hypothetical protein
MGHRTAIGMLMMLLAGDASAVDSLAARILVQGPIRAGNDLPGLPHVEPVIAGNPANPRHLVIASIVVREPNSGAWVDSWMVHVLVSTDGGTRWTRRYLPGLDAIAFAGDPWLAWVSEHSLYLSCIVAKTTGGKRETQVMLYRSTDGGFHWAGPTNVYPPGRFYDHPVMAAVESSLFVFATGPMDGAISVARLLNNSSSISQLPVFHPDSHNNNLGGAVLLSDSSLLFTYYTMTGTFPIPLRAVRSANAGGAYRESEVTPAHVPVGFPDVAVDRSDRFRNRVYCTYVRSEQRPAVLLVSSDDGGATWSAPSMVHTDSGAHLRARPCVAVDNDGNVAVSWVDGRHHDSGLCWDVYFAISVDGGKTFSTERRLTEETTCPNVPKNGAAGHRWRWGGDYSNLIADADGNFHVVWSDTRTGVYQIWRSMIVLNWRQD